MKVSIYQMEIVPGNPQENIRKVMKWVHEVSEVEKPDVIVLPEMWTTSYTLDEIQTLADKDGGTVIPVLQNLAKTYNLNIIGGSFANMVDNKVYNTAVVVDREGNVVYQYDKIHLVPMLNEHKYLTGGQSAPEVFELEGVKMGLIICYDLRFSEIIRPLALEGAEVLFIVAEWPEKRIGHWINLQTTRAIENQMFVVSCNNVGVQGDDVFGGVSMVINPWGDVVTQGNGSEEQTVSANIDINESVEVRKNVPVFSSRVPELYRREL